MSTLTDRYGHELSTGSTEAADAYIEGIDRMLSADGAVEEVLEASITADPGFALAHIALARQHQMLARGREARSVAETAVNLAQGATDRERDHVEIVADVIGGQVPRSLERARAHLAQYPRDAFVLAPACGVFGTIGFSGRVDREAEQLDLLEPLATHYGDDWWFLTVHAFALIETGAWDRGRELAERSLEQRPDNSHAAHTLAHALYEAGRDDEALDFLGRWLPDSDRGSLMHCHNWWHYSILLMSDGRLDEADEAFSNNCLPGHTESASINVFTDSASYLWRSQLAGNSPPTEQWETIRSYYEESFRRPIVFVDAHAGLSYAALGDTDKLNQCIEQLGELGQTGRLPAGTIGQTLAEAYGAFAAENWSRTIDLIEPVMPELARIGGSRAQSDLVTNTLLAAYVKADRLDDARTLVDSRSNRQPNHAVAGFTPAS